MSILFFCGTGIANPLSSTPQVRVMTIKEQNVVPATEYVGHVEAIQSVELRARVEGFLEEVSFTEGDYVQEGQVLYRIEPDGYNARVAMEKPGWPRQIGTDPGPEPSETDAVRQPQSISALDLDNAVAAELAAEASLAAAQAVLDDSELNLAYTTIFAPYPAASAAPTIPGET